MTNIGRNQPCPCGSGRKYKHSCARNGDGASAARAGPASPGRAGFDIRVPAEAIAGHEWQAAIFPVPIAFEDDPRARPTSVMVTANELVCGGDPVARRVVERVACKRG